MRGVKLLIIRERESMKPSDPEIHPQSIYRCALPPLSLHLRHTGESRLCQDHHQTDQKHNTNHQVPAKSRPVVSVLERTDHGAIFSVSSILATHKQAALLL